MKINWKRIASVGLNVGEQLFPVLGVVESFSSFKKLSSKDKQTAAFEALKDQLISSLPSDQGKVLVSDLRFEAAVRKIIDDGVALNNLIAEILGSTQG